MGSAKEVQFKDKKIRVETIKTGQMMLLQGEGKSNNLGALVLSCLSDEDRKYIQDLDYEGEGTEKEMEKLIEAFKEVNPGFFRKKEDKPATEQVAPLGS